MKNEKFQKYLYLIMRKFMGDVSSEYNPELDVPQKGIFYRHELSIADYLMSMRAKLIQEFLNGDGAVETVIFKEGRNVLEKQKDRSHYSGFTADESGNRFDDDVTEIIRKDIGDGQSVRNPDGWKNIEIKYHDSSNNVKWDINSDYAKNRFPTAYSLVQEFGDDCPIASYSYLGPKTVLHRHTGPENRFGEYIRIHIPLIIPPGDLFFEVNGEEVTWDDIFAFDNQLVHSAHNLSDGHRLIFLLDIKRSRIGLANGQPFSKDRQMYALSKPFIRKERRI